MANTNRSPNGMGSVKSYTVNRNGKKYTYWRGRVTVGYDSSGRQVQKTVTGKDKAEVVQQIKAAAISADPATYHPDNKLTLRGWLATWGNEYLNHVSRGTASEYRKTCNRYIVPALGDINLTKLKNHDIQLFINDLIAPKERGGKGLSAKTVKDVFGILHVALEKAKELELIIKNPADRCSLPRVEKPDLIPLEKEALVVFLKAINGHVHENYYKLLIFTGIREAEGLGLTWDAVDFNKKQLRINKQLQRDRDTGEYHLSSPKNHKGRILPISDEVAELLKAQKKAEELKRYASPREWTEHNLVFSNPTGGYLSRQTVYSCFKRIIKKIGVSDLTVHSLRHEYTQLAQENGDDIKTVQEMLGHSSPEFTMRVYAQSSQGMKRNSAERMGQKIRELS